MFALFNCVEVLIIAKDKNEMPINEQIRVAELMVIGPNGEQMGVKNIKDALTLANYAGLDLVLMNGTPGHEVGKIMDYNRYRYERQKKQKEANTMMNGNEQAQDGFQPMKIGVEAGCASCEQS